MFEKEGKVYDIYFSDKYKRSPSAWGFGQTIKEKVLVVKLYTGDSIILDKNYKQFWNKINKKHNLEQFCKISYSKRNDLVNHLVIRDDYLIPENYLINNFKKINNLLAFILIFLIFLLYLSYNK